MHFQAQGGRRRLTTRTGRVGVIRPENQVKTFQKADS